MRLGKFVKSPVEVKRYSVEYSDWLDTGEYVSAVTFGVTPTSASPLVVAAQQITASATRVAFFVTGGDHNETYDVVVQVTTTGGQLKEDTILFAVRDP